MNKLIDKEVIVHILKNWQYPELNIDSSLFPAQEPEDLPDAIRWQDVVKETPKWMKLKGDDLVKFLEEWTYVSSMDDVRSPISYKNGGKTAENPVVIKKLRVVAKEFLIKVGRSILSGHFNLTTIPFPIKFMVPKSYLEYVGCIPSCFFPLYLNLAACSADPIERFRLYIVASICYFFMTPSFAKPLNPILGETFNGHYDDGSHLYLEQISHHPPVSYMLYYGPKEAYKFWGPSQFAASAGFNSVTLTTKAWRKINFKDNNQTIHNTLPNESFEGTLLGTCVHQTIGNMEFVDEDNKIHCNIHFGKVKKRPSDYFEGVITVDGKPVSTVQGTYMGYIEIDNKRYFDYRYTQPFECRQEKSPLVSDFQYRPDKALLGYGYYDEAQKEKEQLEHIQRTDAKLRKQHKGEH